MEKEQQIIDKLNHLENAMVRIQSDVGYLKDNNINRYQLQLTDSKVEANARAIMALKANQSKLAWTIISSVITVVSTVVYAAIQAFGK